MPAIVLRSCYALELSVMPGGSRWAELHVYGEREHVRRCVAAFVADSAGMSAYHAIRYGARLGVWVVQRGVVVEFVDLHPHLRARLDGSDWVRLREAAALVTAARPPDDDDGEHELAIFDRVQLRVDWETFAPRLPTLEPPLLEPGLRTTVTQRQPVPNDTYLGDGEVVRFGSREVEHGERLEPFTIAGWSGADEDDEDEDDEDEDET